MKIKMKSTAAGPAGSFEAGKTYVAPGNLSVDQATAFLNAGAAEAVKEAVERAVLPAPETAEPFKQGPKLTAEEAARKPRRGRSKAVGDE